MGPRHERGSEAARNAQSAVVRPASSLGCVLVDPVRVAVVVLVQEGRVLMGHRRRERRWYPDCWDLVGGHVEPGETPHDAAERECVEEIGVVVHGLRRIPLASGVPSIEVHAFATSSWLGEPVNLATDEHDDLRWFAPEELDGLVLADPTSVPDIIRAVAAHP
jgi:8-oxo-dGTP pyrophosphatase MutT (NUDIX family)